MKARQPIFSKEDEKILKQWKYQKKIRNTTFQTYKSTIQTYTTATGMTITELYKEAITEEEQHIPRYRKSIKTHLIEYHEYLDTLKLKENTKHSYLNIVKSFYQSMDIDIPHIQNTYDNHPVTSTYEKMLTKPLIRLMMRNAITRDKAIISLRNDDSGSKGSVLKDALFPDAQKIEERYKFIKGRKYLLPVAWVARGFVNLKDIPQKLRYMKKVSDADMDAVGEYDEFISKIGL